MNMDSLYGDGLSGIMYFRDAFSPSLSWHCSFYYKRYITNE